jgi:dihydrofolate reductase
VSDHESSNGLGHGSDEREAEQIVAEKESASLAIGVHGSSPLTQSLLVSGLVDELQLVVVPALQGRGRRLFDEEAPRQLALISSVVSPSGSLLLNYRIKR